MAPEMKKLAPVRLIRDYWAKEDERTPAGTILELPTADAKRLIEAGVAERADPMPGE